MDFAISLFKPSHSVASLNVANNTTPGAPKTSTLLRDLPIGDSASNPQNTSVTNLEESNRCILTNASADDMSMPATRVRSRTRNCTGRSCQWGPSIKERIDSSTCVMVPKKRNPKINKKVQSILFVLFHFGHHVLTRPCRRRIVVCLETSLI